MWIFIAILMGAVLAAVSGWPLAASRPVPWRLTFHRA